MRNVGDIVVLFGTLADYFWNRFIRMATRLRMCEGETETACYVVMEVRTLCLVFAGFRGQLVLHMLGICLSISRYVSARYKDDQQTIRHQPFLLSPSAPITSSICVLCFFISIESST